MGNSPERSSKLAIIAVAVNLMAFGLLLGVEAFISHRRWIPARTPRFRYWLDRDLFRFGDTIGLSMVALAVGAILDRAGIPPLWYIWSVIVLASMITMAMHSVWLRQPVRDSAYPPTGVSLLGILHLPYFGAHMVWILLGLWHIANLNVLPFLLVGLGGGIFWVITLIWDARQSKEGS